MFNIQSVTKDSSPVFERAMRETLAQHGALTLNLLTMLVPERGSALEARYETWKKHAHGNIPAFIGAVFREHCLTTFLPKDCQRDSAQRRAVVPAIMTAIGELQDLSLLARSHLYAQGVPHNAVRTHACTGCPHSRCQFWRQGKPLHAIVAA